MTLWVSKSVGNKGSSVLKTTFFVLSFCFTLTLILEEDVVDGEETKADAKEGERFP